MFCGTDVLAAEVSQKSILALPCCMGVIIFCAPHPAWELDFHTWWHLPSQKAIFFHCFNTSAARSSKINKIASRSHGLDVSARKARKANRHKIFTYPPRLRSGRVFRIDQNLTNRSRNVCIPQGISTITTSAPVCACRKFHQNSSNLLEKTRNFNDSHFALFGKHCMNTIAGKFARSSDRFQSTFSTRRSKTQRLDICMVDPDPECGVLMW